MSENKQEGVVLQTLDYRESSRIISLFTPNQGVISLIAKKISKSNGGWLNLTTPLCRGHFIYQTGRSTLHRLVDGHVIDLNLLLRKSYSHLNEAGKMLRALSRSQLQGKPSPHLYELLLAYLRQLPHMSDPRTLGASFLLKILKHDGLLFLSPLCLRCNAYPSTSLDGGESLCSSCADRNVLFFSPSEWEILSKLHSSRQFAPLTTLTLSDTLAKTIEALFYRLSTG